MGNVPLTVTVLCEAPVTEPCDIKSTFHDASLHFQFYHGPDRGLGETSSKCVDHVQPAPALVAKSPFTPRLLKKFESL